MRYYTNVSMCDGEEEESNSLSCSEESDSSSYITNVKPARPRNGEFVWCDDTNTLYRYTDGRLVKIGKNKTSKCQSRMETMSELEDRHVSVPDAGVIKPERM